jgi:TRAP-type transport system periplasmic protein
VLFRNTGAITVTSGRCVPPLYGALSTNTSPGCIAPLRRSMIVFTLSPIEPRYTGMCGALAIRLPPASNSAHEAEFPHTPSPSPDISCRPTETRLRAARSTSEKSMRRLAAAAAVVLGLMLALPALAQTRWDLPTAYPANNFHTENLQQFVSDVDKATGGKLKIQLHPNASLFKAPEIKRAVQGGQAQAGEILLVNFENEDPLYGIDGVPFLATSYGEAFKLYKAEHKALDDKLAKQGMMLLYTVPWPPQGIYTNRTLNSAADMKGLKWRAYSPATSKIAELVGAQPVTVQAAEVSQALATGVIDSYMSSGATGYDSKTYEHLKHFYDTQAWLPKNAVIVNRGAFDALDKPTQAALLKAAAAAETRGWKLSEEKTGWYVDQLRQKGMTIDKPSEQLTADMRKVGNVMLADWLRKSGPDGKKIIDQYRALQ